MDVINMTTTAVLTSIGHVGIGDNFLFNGELFIKSSRQGFGVSLETGAECSFSEKDTLTKAICEPIKYTELVVEK